MLPPDRSFHDADLAAIRRDGASYVLEIEDVAVDDGADVVSGTLTLEGVRRIAVDGKGAGEMAMRATTARFSNCTNSPAPSFASSSSGPMTGATTRIGISISSNAAACRWARAA